MIAVVGCGYWGRNLVRNFHALGELRAICDQRAATLESFSTDFPGVRASQALADVLADPEVTGVAIATPAETHFTLAREALLAGKHVFVEKPLATLEAEGAELVGIARDRGLVLMVGHLLRYHPGFIALQRMVRDGELGRLNYIYSQRLNLGKVRREENILWSFAPHDVSMILALAGGLPETATAIGGNYLHKRIADVTVTHLDFASGLKAHIFVSWLHPFKVQNLVVIGDKQMAVFDDTLPWERKLLVYPLEIHWHDGVPVPSKAPSTAVALEQAEPLRTECEHFVACVRSGTSPRTDGSEGMAVLHVLNACQRSLDSGQSQAIDARYRETAPDFFVHPTSLVDAGSTIGKGSKIWHFSHVLGGCSIGEGCNIGQNVVVGPDVRIGDGCKVQNNVSLYKGVTLEDDVFCGPSMVFTNVFNPRAHIRRMDELRETLVRRGATLGANSTIVCGVTIGRHAFVGAGAVVTRSVPDHALVVGNPARRTGWVCSCGCKLDKALACTGCGLRYQSSPDGLALLESSTSGDHTA